MELIIISNTDLIASGSQNRVLLNFFMMLSARDNFPLELQWWASCELRTYKLRMVRVQNGSHSRVL